MTGAAQIVASTAGYGLLGVFGKRAFAAGLGPGDLLALRFLLATGLLWCYVLATKRQALRLSFRNVGACLLLGICGYAVFTMLFFQALEDLPVSLTVLLLYTYPVLVVLGAYLLFGERVTMIQILALPFVCAGLFLLLGQDVSAVKGRAVGLALCSAVVYALYILVSKRVLRSANAIGAGLLIMTSATASFVLYAPRAIVRAGGLNSAALAAVICLALVCTVAPMVLFLSGLGKLTSAEASILSTVEPLVATVAAVILLRERLSPLQLTGGMLVLCALVLTSIPGPAKMIRGAPGTKEGT